MFVFYLGGRITTNTQNNDTNDRIKKNTKVLNGPGLIRGWGGRARPHSRGYGRGRGMFRRPMETWDPQRSVSTNLNHDNPGCFFLIICIIYISEKQKMANL